MALVVEQHPLQSVVENPTLRTHVLMLEKQRWSRVLCHYDYTCGKGGGREDRDCREEETNLKASNTAKMLKKTITGRTH